MLWVCVCIAVLVIRHLNRIFSALYCVVIRGLFGYTTFFSHSLIKVRDFEKKIIEHKICVLIFSTTFVWNISHSKKNSGRYYHKYMSLFMYSTGYSCQILMKLEFSRQIFQKSLNIKYLKNSSIDSQVVYAFFWAIPRRLNSYAGESPKRKHTTFITRRKFEIKSRVVACVRTDRH